MKLRVEKNPVKQQGRIHTGPLLLTGLLHCGHCGGQMVSAGAKKGDKIYRYYACKANMKSGKGVCPGCRVRAEEFEAAVLKQVLDWAFSLVNVRETLKAVRKALAERSKPIRALQAEADDIGAKLARYYAAFESGAMNADDVGDRVKELRLAQKRIEGEIQSRAAAEELPEHLNRPETIIKAQREFRALFENGSR